MFDFCTNCGNEIEGRVTCIREAGDDVRYVVFACDCGHTQIRNLGCDGGDV
jgi:hypothetical protein